MAINVTKLISEYEESSNYVAGYTTDFPDLDRIVDAVPIHRDPKTPFVGDTTLAGLVRSIPRTSLKQLPVLASVINGSKNTIPAIFCSFLLRRRVFNENTFGKGLLSTLQIGAEQALTHGYAPVLVATGSMYNDFGAPMRLLHYSDTSPEPGISDAHESDYHYVVGHLTPSRVKKILKSAEKDPNTPWNTTALKALLESSPEPKDYSAYQSEPRNTGANDPGETYEIITKYGTGPGAEIITFAKGYPDAPLRVIKSKSKWGYPRVQYLVIDPAPLIPFGISRVRLASPNQNLMNIYLGNIGNMLLINSRPPILKRGTFLKPVRLAQDALWETADPNADASYKSMDNGSLSQFVPMAQQFSAQIQNIMGVPTGAVNGNSNSFGFSKTAPGVKMQQEVQDTANNQITKILENFLRQYALVALDLILSEQSGEEMVIVDDEAKNAINKVAGSDVVGDDNKLRIVWEELYESIEEWSVEVDVSLSPDELKDQKRADLQDMLVVLAQNAQELGPGAVEKVQEITNMLLEDKTPLVSPMEGAPMLNTPIDEESMDLNNNMLQ